MLLIAAELEALIKEHVGKLYEIPQSDLTFKPSPTKWSKKEIIGHMADSAQNNIRRFVVAQYENNPYIVYDQDKWVAISNYQEYELPDLIELWFLLNKHIVTILRNTSSEAAQRSCKTQEQHTLEWLASDYIKHLRHHMHQVLGLEPFPYP